MNDVALASRPTAQPDSRCMAQASGRIAMLLGSFRVGGIARTTLSAAEEFLRRGFAVDLVVTKRQGELLHAVPQGAAVIELEQSSTWRARAAIAAADPGCVLPLLRAIMLRQKPSGKLRYLSSLVRYFRTAQPHGIFAATAPLNLMAVWGRRLARLDSAVIVSERNQLAAGTVGTRRWRHDCPPDLVRHGYLGADGIVAVSDGVAAELSAQVGIPRDRITTVYNGVALATLTAKAQEPIAHPWFAPDQPAVVLGVGKLKPQKDFITLVRAFARLRRERSARLVILGDVRGPGKDTDYVAELRALPAQLDVDEDVDFAGFADNPFAFMARAAVFVLSSRYEGLPGVLIQALSCGCPVVSTDCPSGPAEILDHGRYGPLVPVGDDAALATAICRVLDAPLPPEELTGRATLFSVERAVDRYLELMFGPQTAPPYPQGTLDEGVDLVFTGARGQQCGWSRGHRDTLDRFAMQIPGRCSRHRYSESHNQAQARLRMSKVFGIGLPKTGTTSLRRALEMLGYTVVHDPETFDQIDRHDAATDSRVADTFEELDRRYPGSRFIYTARDRQAWVKSLVHQFEKTDMDFKRRKNPETIARYERLYGAATIDETAMLAAFDRYEQRVHQYFQGRDDLLIIDVCAPGDKWPAICRFLGQPVPDAPFPHLNRTPSAWRRWGRYLHIKRKQLRRNTRTIRQTLSFYGWGRHS